MAAKDYSRFVITDSTPRISPFDLGEKSDLSRGISGIVNMDAERVEGAFYVDCSWLLKRPDTAHPTHSHDFDEFLTFWGTDPADPHNLCGEIELQLEDETHVVNKSCLVFIPSGMTHSAVVKRVDRPILHFSAGTASTYTENSK